MERQKKLNIVGQVLTALIAIPFFMSAMMKFKGGPEMMEGWNHFGWPAELLLTIGILEAASVLLYMIPQTAVLGAILLTGYLGGAIATHLRVSEGVPLQVLFGVLIWGALFLRDERLRQLLPFRK
jgi:hypothetical protein